MSEERSVRIVASKGSARVTGVNTDGMSESRAFMETAAFVLDKVANNQPMIEISQGGCLGTVSTRVYAQALVNYWNERKDEVDFNSSIPHIS